MLTLGERKFTGHKRSHKVTFYFAIEKFSFFCLFLLQNPILFQPWLTFLWTTFVPGLFLVGGLVYDELGEGEEEGMDDINDDVSTQETICPEDGDDRKVDS